jgi:hypothetical protein
MKLTVLANQRYMQDFAASGVCQLAMNGDAVSYTDGIQGDGQYVLSAAKSGTLTLTFFATSPSLKYLRDWAQRKVKFPVSVSDQNSDDKKFMSASNCMVQKVPDANGASDVSVAIIVPEVVWR